MPVQLLTSSDYNDSPSHDVEVGTGRATCRFCGTKILKGELSIAFYPSPGGGCSWQAITAHVYRSCAADRMLPLPKERSRCVVEEVK